MKDIKVGTLQKNFGSTKSRWNVNHRLGWYLLAVVAAALDATTTTIMLNSGLFEEANPAAAHIMGITSPTMWIIGATILFLGLTTPLLLQADSFIKKALISYAIILVGLKLVAGINNLTLYFSINL